jgi:heptosyltransferase III
MKILVLQLARLGDIYQTWPTLRALHRSFPGAEVHFLTRTKFAAAAPRDPGLVHRHWTLDTREVLTPLVDEKPDVDKSLEKLDVFCEQLKAEGFDRIVNLSFSPFSSYLVQEIAGEGCEIRGYTRFKDDTLCIPDDGSAYFYAQVGTGGASRIHVTDLFAHIAGIELTLADWAPPATDAAAVGAAALGEAGNGSILIHVGASDPGKTFSWSKWSQIVKGLASGQRRKIVLIGSAEEADWAERIAANVSAPVVNLVGRTNLMELTELIRSSALLIGGDSAPVQIASLTGTPVLNVSFPMVSFWETGPRSGGSRVVVVEDESALVSDDLVSEALAMLDGGSTPLSVVRIPGPVYPYVETRPMPRAFEWELLKAVYMSETFPEAPHALFLNAVDRLVDVNQLAREQIESLRKNPYNQTAASILDRVDEIMDQILVMVPELGPIVRWFKTERLRIGPMEVARLIEQTDVTHKNLGDVIALYSSVRSGAQEGPDDDVVLGS